MYRLALIFFSAFFLLSSPVMAKDGRQGLWIVSQLSGDARVVHGGLQPASLKVNSRLSPGDVVITGATGRATLSRNADYIVIAPRSELRLPSAPQPSGFTRVVQKIGTMLFKVQHTGTPHFAVDTPMLAAVVKGTTFTVVVGQNRSAVQVTEGVVEVSANDGGMKLLVNGGKTVFIDHGDPKTLIDADSQPTKATTASSAAVKVSGSKAVSLAAIAGLTSGLVRPDATPQPVTVVATAATVAASPTPAPTTGAATTPGTAGPVVDMAENIVTDVTDPAVEVVEDTVTGVTDPVVEVVEDTVSDVVEPVVEVVDDTVTDVVEPVVEVVDTTVPEVIEPVVEAVDTTVPEVVEPVVEVVDTTVPEVTEPVVEVVETTVPEVTEPAVEVVETTVPEVVAPVVEVVETTVPTVPEVQVPELPAPTVPTPW